MATVSPDFPKPELSPSPPPRTLLIANNYPVPIYQAIENQYGRKDVMGMGVGFLGETIGFARIANPKHPLQNIETKIHGNMMHTKYEPIPGKPSQSKGVGEPRKEFNIQTHFKLHKHTYIGPSQAGELIAHLKSFGYECNLNQIENGNRKLVIITPEGSFDFFIGWPDAQSYAQNFDNLHNKYPLSGYGNLRDQILKGQETSEMHFQLTGSQLGIAPDGIPLESQDQVVKVLERSRDLAEAIASSLTVVLSPGNQFPVIRMDWLPPHIIEQMEFNDSSTLSGKVDATSLVETQVPEDHGFERIVGLSDITMSDLSRIKNKLSSGDRAAFLKKHGFKQSTGAVFWGDTGTGKTLAAQAVAEEAGCERVVVKIDEYLTAYMHDSAARIGDKLRGIKERATENGKPIVVHIDEADTILMPVNGNASSARDAAEIRAVLLREFQEPSNVFFILTTNLDPRDPRQADPAIVRNERLGYLVAFDLPTAERRKLILDKEIGKRTGDDIIWQGVNTEELAILSENFSPADIQAILSEAADIAFNEESRMAIIMQGSLKTAIERIAARKEIQQRIRKPIGF